MIYVYVEDSTEAGSKKFKSKKDGILLYFESKEKEFPPITVAEFKINNAKKVFSLDHEK